MSRSGIEQAVRAFRAVREHANVASYGEELATHVAAAVPEVQRAVVGWRGGWACGAPVVLVQTARANYRFNLYRWYYDGELTLEQMQ